MIMMKTPKTQKPMNKINLKTLVLALPMMFFYACGAQPKAISTAEFSLESGQIDELLVAKEEIDNASKHEKTKNSARMWFVRGKVYARIYDKRKVELISPVAYLSGIAAGKSYLEFYNSTDSKKGEYLEEANNELKFGYISTFYESQTFGEKYSKATDAILKAKLADTLVEYYQIMLTLYDKLDTGMINDFKRSQVERKFFIERLALYSLGNSDETSRMKILSDLSKNEKPIAAVVESLSHMYLEKHDTLGAKVVIKEALAKSNGDNDIFQVLVNYYISIHKETELFSDINDQIKLNPTTKSYWIRGYLNEQQNKYNEAIADYYDSRKLDEFNYDANWNLGVALYKYKVRELREEQGKATPDVKKQIENQIQAIFTEAKGYLEFAAENTNYSVQELKDIAKAIKNVCIEVNDKTCMTAQRDRIRLLDGISIGVGTKFKYVVSGTASSFDISYTNKMNTVSVLTDVKGNWEKEFDYIDKSDMLSVGARNNGKSGTVKVQIFVDGVMVKEMEAEGAGKQVAVQI